MSGCGENPKVGHPASLSTGTGASGAQEGYNPAEVQLYGRPGESDPQPKPAAQDIIAVFNAEGAQADFSIEIAEGLQKLEIIGDEAQTDAYLTSKFPDPNRAGLRDALKKLIMSQDNGNAFTISFDDKKDVPSGGTTVAQWTRQKLTIESSSDHFDRAKSIGVIYGYSFEGHCYKLPKPVVMLLPSEPAEITGCQCGYTSDLGFAVWTIDKRDYCVSLNTNMDSIQTLVLDTNMPGNRSPLSYAQVMAMAPSHHRGRE